MKCSDMLCAGPLQYLRCHACSQLFVKGRSVVGSSAHIPVAAETAWVRVSEARLSAGAYAEGGSAGLVGRFF